MDAIRIVINGKSLILEHTMNLFNQLQEKVLQGNLTYQQILLEIQSIKACSHLPEFFKQEKDEVILENLEDQGPGALDILIKKDAWELLSEKTKKVAEIILNCDTIDKRKIYKQLRDNGMKRAEILKVERELKKFSQCLVDSH
jgi:hypothetical protein